MHHWVAGLFFSGGVLVAMRSNYICFQVTFTRLSIEDWDSILAFQVPSPLSWAFPIAHTCSQELSVSPR